MTSRTQSRPRLPRLVWLDLARVLFALMILGIHWLRAGYYVGLFGAGDPVNLVINYQGQSGGLRMLHYVLIAGNGPSAAIWLTNLTGVLGGFGWEAVSALIIVSGFSLAMTQRDPAPTRAGWWSWWKKRAARILVPFYIASAAFLGLYATAILILPHLRGHALAAIFEGKLLTIFHTPMIGVILSHIFLIDPYAYQWTPDLFAPAWWFVPAILLAYTLYPLLWRLSGVRGGVPLLAGAAIVTIVAYVLSDAHVLYNEAWYYIVLHECFNFSLGIVVGRLWVEGRRATVERVLDSRPVFVAACTLFVLGNIANWSPAIRPVASMLYGPSLVLATVFIARRVEGHRLARALTAVDPYNLYIVHQPFAFPIALLAGAVFHGYATFAGWFVFVLVAWVAAKLLSAAQRPFFGALSAPAPARRAASRLHVKHRAS